ncbi:MAG TPA: sigma-54 dependent transcriptional regulator [Longimicrobiales bacterium]
MIVGDDAAESSARTPEGGALTHLNGTSGLQILIVDDETTLRESCASVLRLEGYAVTHCGDYARATELIEQRSFDILLLDLNIAQHSGLDLLRSCLDLHPEAVAIVMTGNPTIASSVEAIAAGAWNYLPKPFSANHLQILIGSAAHGILSRRTNGNGAYELNGTADSNGVRVIGDCDNFRRMVAIARKAAQTDASIFLSGESGTGKEQIANFIHAHSRRSLRPLVAINCAALPEALLESEMFGHVAGAFTGASRDKPGLLEVANGGTMFLDELTEMPPSTQAKLLRVIQDGAVRRLGSNDVEAVVNVRFIAATNRDPREAVKSGHLREDLYYRLRVVPIYLPPLRDRLSDIPLLADYFLGRYWQVHRDSSSPLPRFSEAAIRSLQGRPWRGNIRELQNVIEHAVVLLQPGTDIQPEDLPVLEESGSDSGSEQVDVFNENDSYYGARDRVVSRFERTYLKWLVGKASGNMSMAARIAGVDRTTLYRLMEKHSVQRDTIITIR